jgi:hypothetical protein
MDTWHGHSTITSSVLVALLRRAGAGDTTFTAADRVLYTVCEFWAAAAADGLVEHLGSEPLDRLRAAYVAFSAIGAVQAAGTLRGVVDQFPEEPPSAKWVQERSSELEAGLRANAETVDRLIAKFASRRVEEGKSPPGQSPKAWSEHRA